MPSASGEMINTVIKGSTDIGKIRNCCRGDMGLKAMVIGYVSTVTILFFFLSDTHTQMGECWAPLH